MIVFQAPAQCPKITGWWFQPLWKIWKSVVHLIPNIWKNKIHVPNSKPPTREGKSYNLKIIQLYGIFSYTFHSCGKLPEGETAEIVGKWKTTTWKSLRFPAVFRCTSFSDNPYIYIHIYEIFRFKQLSTGWCMDVNDNLIWILSGQNLSTFNRLCTVVAFEITSHLYITSSWLKNDQMAKPQFDSYPIQYTAV